MILIPVIDLKAGEVVHARLGQRGDYRPVRSSLVDGHDPRDVVAAFLRLHPFTTVYIADLDSIADRGDNHGAIAAVRSRFPALELWTDAGLATPAAAAGWQARGLGRPVIGAESLPAAEAWNAILEETTGEIVLSLDFQGDRFLGPPRLLADAGSWPRDVIVMTLGRVGSAAGPDLEKIRAIARRAGGRRVFAAGGVRGVDDLERLAEAGAGGALLASALHDGRLSAEDIAGLCTGKPGPGDPRAGPGRAE